MSKVTGLEALKLIAADVQGFRENGESDMRSVLNSINYLRSQIANGMTAEEIWAERTLDDEGDE